MGSRARGRSETFGPPTMHELAYFAGLIDRAGGLTTEPPGIKIACQQPLGSWLEDRFDGVWAAGVWWLRAQQPLYAALHRIAPFLVARLEECLRLEALVDHHLRRSEYNATPEWDADRRALVNLVRGR